MNHRFAVQSVIALACLVALAPEASARGCRWRLRRCRPACVETCPAPPAASTAPVYPSFVWELPDGRQARYHIEPALEPAEGEADAGADVSPFAFAPRWDASEQDFEGSYRKGAKTSIVDDAPLQSYASVAALRATLPEDGEMREGHEPPIGKDTPRVDEELRRVRVTAWLLAATKPEDNDYHLILSDTLAGDDPDRLLTAEVSGLPKSGPYRTRLRLPREQYQEHFGGEPPGSGYKVWEEVWRVRVEGSLFFDRQHKPGKVGPAEHAPSTVWEIHPVTSIEFVD
jgi:hypothetical protein